MRKKITAGTLMLTLMLAAGCGKDDEQSGVKKIERTSSVATVSTTEATTGAVTEATTGSDTTDTQETTGDTADTSTGSSSEASTDTSSTEVTTESGSNSSTETTTEQTTTDLTTASATESTTEKTTKTTTETTTESTTEKTTKTTTESTTEKTTKTTSETTTESATQEPAELKDIDVSTEDKMREYLDGSWTMVVGGNPITTRPGSTILWDKNTSFIELSREENDIYIYAYTDFESLFQDGRDYTNFMNVQVDYASGMDQSITDSRATIQLMTAVTNRGKVFGIRETGNGESQFAYYGLDYENTAWENMWVFRKDEDAPVITAEMNDSLLKKGQSFYAFKWFDSGSSVNLQPMDVINMTDNWYGEELHVLTYIRSSDPMSIYAPTYEIKGAEDKANSGGYQPCLCYVTTDGNGRITEIKQFKYLGYGVYDADSAY